MAGTLPIGTWSWHERWLYPDQLHDLPEKPYGYAEYDNFSQARLRQLANHSNSSSKAATARGPAPSSSSASASVSTSASASQTPRPLSTAATSSTSGSSSPSSYANNELSISEAERKQAEILKTEASLPGLSFDTREWMRITELAESSLETAKKRREEHKDASTLATPQLPDLPRRYRDGTFLRHTSEYNGTYRPPIKADPYVYKNFSTNNSMNFSSVPNSPTSSSSAASSSYGGSVTSRSSVPGARLPPRQRKPGGAPSDFMHHHLSPFWHEGPEVQKNLRPEQHAFRLWGRINPAHCVIPYETETQRNYNQQATIHALPPDYVQDKTHHLRVEGKDYKEAFMKARNMGLVRAANSKGAKKDK